MRSVRYFGLSSKHLLGEKEKIKKRIRDSLTKTVRSSCLQKEIEHFKRFENNRKIRKEIELCAEKKEKKRRWIIRRKG